VTRKGTSAVPHIGQSGLLALILVVAGAVYFSGLTPWPLVLWVGALATVALARWFGWAVAMAVVVLTAGFVTSLLLRWYPALAVDLGTANGVVLVTLGVAATIMAAFTRRPFSAPSARFVRVALASMVAPLIAALLIGIDLARFGVEKISWAMNNDAVWNTVTARFITDDGGLNAATHPNSSPLTAMVLASSMAPGRGFVPGSALLEHDVLSEAAAWLVITLLASVFAGLIVARNVRHRAGWQIMWGAVGGAIPLTWYVTGFSFQYGFYNAPVSLLLLLAAWVLWTDGARAPYLATVALLLGTTALLATWAPLAIVSLALALVNVIRSRERLWRERTVARLACLGGAALQV
jgi:hypothetical protein